MQYFIREILGIQSREDWDRIERMMLVASTAWMLDAATKAVIILTMQVNQQKVVLNGFFKFVYWGNTGAAWSLFYGYNRSLAVIALFAMVLLFCTRHKFDFHTTGGQIALGLMFGGILGNLLDRIRFGHVVDFIYFHIQSRGGGEIGFPAFNVADSVICAGVGLILLFAWRNPPEPAKNEPKPETSVPRIGDQLLSTEEKKRSMNRGLV